MIDRIMQRTLPDFLGIGAHRSGTTWLWENLGRHPDVWLWRTKELHFFDRSLKRRYLPMLSLELEAVIRYIPFFLLGKLAGRIVGEFTPAYAILSKDKIDLVHTLMPRVKILFIMRDPVLRAWSHAKKDFSRLTGKSLEEASEDELMAFFQRPQVVRRGDYLTCLKNWTEFYDLSQLFICFTQEIATEPVLVLKQLFQFLGLDPEVKLDWTKVRKPVHVGPNIPIPESVRGYLGDSLYKQNGCLESLTGRSVPWGREYNNLLHEACLEL